MMSFDFDRSRGFGRALPIAAMVLLGLGAAGCGGSSNGSSTSAGGSSGPTLSASSVTTCLQKAGIKAKTGEADPSLNETDVLQLEGPPSDFGATSVGTINIFESPADAEAEAQKLESEGFANKSSFQSGNAYVEPAPDASSKDVAAIKGCVS
jgi:hypothetical protein